MQNTLLYDNTQNGIYKAISRFTESKVNIQKNSIPFTDIHINLIVECIYSIYSYLNTHYYKTNNAYKNISNFMALADKRISLFQFKNYHGDLNGKYYHHTKEIGISDEFSNLTNRNKNIFIHTVIHEFLHAITPYGLNSYYNARDRKPEFLNHLFTILYNEKYLLLMEYANEKATIKIEKEHFTVSPYSHYLHICRHKTILNTIVYKNYAVDYKELIACENFFNFVFADDLETAHLSDELNIRNIIKGRGLEKWSKDLVVFLKSYQKLYHGGIYNKSHVQYNRYLKAINTYNKMVKKYTLHKSMSNGEKYNLEKITSNTLFAKNNVF